MADHAGLALAGSVRAPARRYPIAGVSIPGLSAPPPQLAALDARCLSATKQCTRWQCGPTASVEMWKTVFKHLQKFAIASGWSWVGPPKIHTTLGELPYWPTQERMGCPMLGRSYSARRMPTRPIFAFTPTAAAQRYPSCQTDQVPCWSFGANARIGSFGCGCPSPRTQRVRWWRPFGLASVNRPQLATICRHVRQGLHCQQRRQPLHSKNTTWSS
jgi:hypothetical protein